MKLAIGSANLGIKYGLFGKKKFNSKEILKVEKLIFESKIEYIDTAHDYIDSEKTIGKSKLKNLKIITKIKLPEKKIINVGKQISQIISKSLKRLKKKNVYSVLVHNHQDLLGKKGLEFLKELKLLKKRGIIKNIGISIYDTKELAKIWKFWKPDIVQAPLNLYDQRILRSGWLKILKDNNVKFFARSCFLQGLLIGDYNSLNISKKLFLHLKKFDNWCISNNISRVKACLDFVRQFKEVSCIILGYDDAKQLNTILHEFKKQKKIIPLKFKLNNLNYIDPRKWK